MRTFKLKITVEDDDDITANNEVAVRLHDIYKHLDGGTEFSVGESRAIRSGRDIIGYMAWRTGA